MPRVAKMRSEDEVRRNETRKIIRRGMINQDMPHLDDLAEAMGKSRPVISKRMISNSWSLEEAVRLAKVLKLSAEDAAVIMGISR